MRNTDKINPGDLLDPDYRKELERQKKERDKRASEDGKSRPDGSSWSNLNGDTYVKINGHIFRVESNSNRVVCCDESSEGDRIATAINSAIIWLINQPGGKDAIGNFDKFISDIADFATKNFSMFKEIYNSPDSLEKFFYHATVGTAISNKMTKSNFSELNKYDQEIGFWVSFWAEREEMTCHSKGIQLIGNAINPGLVNIAMFVKAMMFYESEIGQTPGYLEPDENLDAGLMQVDIRGGEEWWSSNFENCLNFKKGTNEKGRVDPDKMKKFNDSFNNIGIGVGHLFYKLSLVADYPFYDVKDRQAPTWKQWKIAIELYNGSEKYANKVWALVQTGEIIEMNPDGTPREYKGKRKIW